MYLVFDTEMQAQAAVDVIDIELSYPNEETKTQTWAIPIQTLTGKWIIKKPDCSLANIADSFIEQEKQLNWFDEGM